MSSLLNDFEQQYSVQTAEITAKIGGLERVPIHLRSNSIQDIHRSLIEVENLLEQMEIAIRELDASSAERSKYGLRARSYRNDRKQLGLELDKAIKRLHDVDNSKELLTYDGENKINQQDQLIDSTERLERTSRRLQDTYRMVIETEQIGTGVLEDLNSQRETMLRSRDRLRQADTDINRTQKLLSLITRRLIQNRLLLFIISVLLLVVLLFAVYKSV